MPVSLSKESQDYHIEKYIQKNKWQKHKKHEHHF